MCRPGLTRFITLSPAGIYLPGFSIPPLRGWNWAPLRICALLVLVATGTAAVPQEGKSEATWPAPQEGNFVVRDFRFRSGEMLPELRIHYTTLGKPTKDSAGRTTNAVLILHGTSGSGRQFLQARFAGVLFGPGQFWMRRNISSSCRTT